MSATDPLSDLLTRIRNGQSANKKTIMLPSSKLKIAVCSLLVHEGYINCYSVTGDESKRLITIQLKYDKDLPVIENIRRVSRPGRRVYKSAEKIPYVLGGFGIAVISTSKGLMTDKQARESGLGGEVLCSVS
jgi:small subunit ribosomal protein S8